MISVGTGGSITGTARYLKEQKPDLLVVGADPEGSIYSGGPVHPYLVEGIGKDGCPESFDPSVVDEYVRVSDRDSFLMTRRLAREEGILAGGSGGTSVFAMLEVAKRFGPDATILTTIPDGGRGYLSKIYDDNWMLEHGFLERHGPPDTVEQVLAFKHARERRPRPRHLRAAPEARRRDRADAALRDLAAAGRPPRPGRDARRRDRLPERAHAPRPRLPQPGRARRGRRRARCSRRSAPSTCSDSVDEVFADLRGDRTRRSSSPARASPQAVLTRSDLLEYLAHRR